MKVKVLKVFRDKLDKNHIFKIGEEVDFERNRALAIIEMGLGEVNTAEEAPPPAATKTKKTRKTKTL